MLDKSPDVPICSKQSWHPFLSLMQEHSQCQKTKSSWLYQNPLLAQSHVSYLEHTASHSPAAHFIKKLEQSLAQQCPKSHMHCHSLLHATEHLLAQQEPCRQNWWTGHFGLTLCNSVLILLPFGKCRLWYTHSCLVWSHCKPWTHGGSIGHFPLWNKPLILPSYLHSSWAN